MMNYGYSTNNKHTGFTLIEVMVAVAVVAVALPALTMAMMSQIDGTAYLRDKMQAHWLAENKLAEMRILNRTTGQVPKALQDGTEELAARQWRWQIRSQAFSQKEFKDIYGLEVSVWREEDSLKDDSPLVQLVGIMQQFKQEVIQRPAAISPPASGGNNNTPADSNNSGNASDG